MPFISDLVVFSRKPVDIQANSTRRIAVESGTELLRHPVLTSVASEAVQISIANSVLRIDCSEQFSRGLGITFCRVYKYKGKDGLRKAFISIDIEKHKDHKRLPFVLGQVFRAGPIECTVPGDSLVEFEHSLNVNAPMFPTAHHDILLWSGLVSIGATKYPGHLENGLDFSQKSAVHVYRIAKSLLLKHHIEELAKNEGILCLVGIAAQTFIQYTDHTAPSTELDVPPVTFLTWKTSGNNTETVNYS